MKGTCRGVQDRINFLTFTADPISNLIRSASKQQLSSGIHRLEENCDLVVLASTRDQEHSADLAIICQSALTLKHFAVECDLYLK